MAEDAPKKVAMTPEMRAAAFDILRAVGSVYASANREVKPLPKHAEVNAYRMAGRAAFDLLRAVAEVEAERKKPIIVTPGGQPWQTAN